MARLGQFSFAGGELDPLLHGRVDLQQYGNSVSLARNFFAKKYGGLANRAGTRLVLETATAPWLLPFNFGSAQSYVLTLTDQACRFLTQGGVIEVEATDATLVNGDFSGGITGWTDESAGSATVLAGSTAQAISPTGATRLGNMTFAAGIAAAFDGVTAKINGQCAQRRNANSGWVGLDWGSGNDKTVVGVRIYGSTDAGLRGDNPNVTLDLEGSADAFATAVLLGSVTVRDANGIVVELTDGVITSTAYRYHRVVIRGGSSSSNAIVAQVEFLGLVTTVGRATLTGDSGDAAILQQQMTTTDLDQEHVLGVTVEGSDLARVLVRIGASSGGAEFLDDYELEPGLHAVAFTPGASPFYLQFRNADDEPVTVRSVRLLDDEPLQIPTPYLESEVERITYTQSRDVMTLCHPNHAPRELIRRGHLSWSLTPLELTPDVAAPTNLSATLAAGSGSTTHTYVVTASRDGLESLPSASDSVSSAPATLTPTNNVGLTWTAVAGAESYAVYKNRNGLFGFIGTTETTSFTDDGINAAVDDTPPRARDPFSDGRHPAAVDYFEQRLAFGGGTLTPEVGQLSRTGDFRNFAVSEPLKDDDAIAFRPAGRKMGEIRHLLGMRSLLIFTSETVWSLSRGENGLTPALEGGLQPQDGPGASFVQPLAIGRYALYVRDGGDAAMGMAYEFAADGWTTADLTLLAGHLLRPRRIRQWSWARRPWALVWAVCGDGVALSCTYEPEQQVTAWTRHETQGRFLSVCAVDEGLEDAAYFAVARRLNGVWRYFVERMASRQIVDVRDSYFVDCGLSYDEPHAVTGCTAAEPVILTAPGHDFLAGDFVDVNGLVGPTVLNDRRYRVGVVAGDSFELLTDIPSDPPSADYIDGRANPAWIEGGTVRKALASFSVPHLEGETVAILADGGELAQEVVPAGGTITLLRPASRCHIGLPYNADMISLPLAGTPANGGGPELTGAKKAVKAVYVFVDASRRLQAGPTLERLDSFKPPAPQLWDVPEQPISRMIRVPIEARWGEQPRVAVRQAAPLPVEVLAIIPEIDVGG